MIENIICVIWILCFFIIGFSIANLLFGRKIGKILKVIGRQIDMAKDIEDKNERERMYSKIDGEQQIIRELLKRF